MIGYKAHKYRIYPDKEQKSYLAQCFGAKRWIFNHFLEDNKNRFLNKEKHLNAFGMNYEITKLKKDQETAWLKDIDVWCLRHAAEDLHNAYQQFFRSATGKRKGAKVSHPKFKTKYDRQSYRTKGIKIDFDADKVKIPKLNKQIKCVIDRRFVGTIKQATISRNASGEYYISILVEEEYI